MTRRKKRLPRDQSEDVPDTLQRLGSVFRLLDVSDPYPNRRGEYVRVYVEADPLDPDGGTKKAVRREKRPRQTAYKPAETVEPIYRHPQK